MGGLDQRGRLQVLADGAQNNGDGSRLLPLPAGRGSFGSGAVELMAGQDVFMTLFEYGEESVGTEFSRHRGSPATSRRVSSIVRH